MRKSTLRYALLSGIASCALAWLPIPALAQHGGGGMAEEAADFMVVAAEVVSTVAVGAGFTAASQAAGTAALTGAVVTADTVAADLADTADVRASPVAAAHSAACGEHRPQAEVSARRDPGHGKDAEELPAIPRPAGILSDPGMARAWRAQAADRSLVLPAERALEMQGQDRAV